MPPQQLSQTLTYLSVQREEFKIEEQKKTHRIPLLTHTITKIISLFSFIVIYDKPKCENSLFYKAPVEQFHCFLTVYTLG